MIIDNIKRCFFLIFLLAAGGCTSKQSSENDIVDRCGLDELLLDESDDVRNLLISSLDFYGKGDINKARSLAWQAHNFDQFEIPVIASYPVLALIECNEPLQKDTCTELVSEGLDVANIYKGSLGCEDTLELMNKSNLSSVRKARIRICSALYSFSKKEIKVGTSLEKAINACTAGAGLVKPE